MTSVTKTFRIIVPILPIDDRLARYCRLCKLLLLFRFGPASPKGGVNLCSDLRLWSELPDFDTGQCLRWKT